MARCRLGEEECRGPFKWITRRNRDLFGAFFCNVLGSKTDVCSVPPEIEEALETIMVPDYTVLAKKQIRSLVSMAR